MKVITRLLITAILITSVAYGINYYLTRPEPDMMSYYSMSDIESEDYSTNFHSDLDSFISESSMSSLAIDMRRVNRALDNSYNYYKNKSVYIKQITAESQNNLNDKIKSYNQSKQYAYKRLNQFDENAGSTSKNNTSIVFINAYNDFLIKYSEMIVELRDVVNSYAYDSFAYTEKNLLLDAQLDLGYAILHTPMIEDVYDITADLDIFDYIITDYLNGLTQDYNNYDNTQDFTNDINLELYYLEVDLDEFYQKIIEGGDLIEEFGDESKEYELYLYLFD